MPYVADTNIDLTPRTTEKYYISSAHRRRQANKSRWTITPDQEVDCFILSQTSMWVEKVTSWGLIINGNNLHVLGLSYHDEELKIAKFVVKNNAHLWHGYPADYCRNFQDRPGIKILQNWRDNGHIEKHHIVKIRKGIACNL